MALSPSAAANRRFGFQFKPEITPPPIPTNPGTAPAACRKGEWWIGSIVTPVSSASSTWLAPNPADQSFAQ
jgi:hypothetical protein